MRSERASMMASTSEISQTKGSYIFTPERRNVTDLLNLVVQYH